MITVREAYLLSISRFLSKRNTKSANPTILFKQTSLANFISIQNTSFAINLPILAHMCLCESRPTDRLMSNYADSKHIPAPSQTANLARNVPFFNPSSSQRHSHSRGFTSILSLCSGFPGTCVLVVLCLMERKSDNIFKWKINIIPVVGRGFRRRRLSKSHTFFQGLLLILLSFALLNKSKEFTQFSTSKHVTSISGTKRAMSQVC